MSRRDTIDRSMVAIARRLRATREALGLNQRQLCSRAGLAYNQYNQWEKGHIRPGLDGAIALCDTFELTLDWIYFGDPARLPMDIAEKVLRYLEDDPPSNKLKSGPNLSLR